MQKISPQKLLLSFTLALGVLALVGAVWLYRLFLPVNATVQQGRDFIVPRGQAISVIGERLQEAGLIRSSLAFRIAVKVNKLEQKIQAGTFVLSPSMSTAEVAHGLTQGTQDIWITLLEGWRREEIADSLAEQPLANYDKATFLALSQGSEGRLFPDTYLVPKEITTEGIHALLTDTFETKTAALADDFAASPYSEQEILTMASIVEREARGFAQMQLVAGILWNRIELGIPLQVDASLQYVKGYSATQQSWWVPPLAQDKQLDSRYNTYQYPGLPPGPIANPSLDAIRATLNPRQSEYLYYIHDSSGAIHYASTLEEHNQNIDRYLR